jgi:gas vesicle protein
MIARMRTAMKFFTYGLVIGLLFAPRSGKETRGRVITWISENAKSVIGG